jgi:hypothetical protein
MEKKYIDANTFEAFKCNQDKLIEILNHNMTQLTIQSKRMSDSNIKLANDVTWLKKIIGIQTGLIAGVFIALLGVVLKLVL